MTSPVPFGTRTCLNIERSLSYSGHVSGLLLLKITQYFYFIYEMEWPCTMTPSIDQTLHQFANLLNLLPNWTLLPTLTLLPTFGGFHRTLQRVRLANRGSLLLRIPGPVQFGTCICSNVETILSWTCHVYGPFEFRTSLGTSILLQFGT